MIRTGAGSATYVRVARPWLIFLDAAGVFLCPGRHEDARDVQTYLQAFYPKTQNHPVSAPATPAAGTDERTHAIAALSPSCMDRPGHAWAPLGASARSYPIAQRCDPLNLNQPRITPGPEATTATRPRPKGNAHGCLRRPWRLPDPCNHRVDPSLPCYLRGCCHLRCCNSKSSRLVRIAPERN